MLRARFQQPAGDDRRLRVMTAEDPSKQNHSKTFLIVGLGNPGEEYASTRHNVGFMVVEVLAQQLGLSLSRNSHEALWTSAPFGDDQIVVAEPTTFMNDSGRAVKALLTDLDLDPGSMLVVHDDIDLPLGEVRVKSGGSSGGHRGVDSIVAVIGTEDFVRARIGVGRPPGKQDPAEYVLRDFSKADRTEIDFAITTAAQAIVHVLEYGLESAMNEYNG